MIKLQEIINHCSGKKGVTQDFPFYDTTLVLKVKGKMFALIPMDDPRWINLKCDPVYALALRGKYKSVKPGYHMNKNHWNTIDLNGDVSESEILEMIDDSYNLVVKRLTKKLKEELINSEG